MPSNDSERGVGAWARRWWRPLAAELMATLLLIMLGVAAILPVEGPRALTHPALAFGFLVMALIEVFGGASGAHMNPAVTLAAVVAGQLPGVAAAAYVLAQLVGSLLGFGALLLVSPKAREFGGTMPNASVGVAGAVAVEAALTGLLAMLACAVWAAHDAARPDRSVSIKFGLLVAGLIYSGGPLTGASLNPARSFAPAVLQGNLKDHWVYWVGPLLGALVGALLHRALVAPPRRPRTPEALPLSDKREP